MSLPLSGVRIIAVEQYGAGPFGTQQLADMGAEIIKIENPDSGGDVGRLVGPYYFGPGDSHFFEAFNRNKKSFTLNLKHPKSHAVLVDLAKHADAVFNNLRGDLPDKLQITYKHLGEHNPKLVCAHLSAYGRTGSRANWPGYDYLMQSETGYLSLTGEPGGPPTRMGVSVVDFMTGITSVTGLLAGIIEARSTGKGRDIDVSLFNVALYNLNYLAAWYLNEGVIVKREPRSAHPSLTPSQLYRTKDSWIFLMCNKEEFWRQLVKELDQDQLTNSPDYTDYESRLENREKLTRDLDAVFQTATTDQWLKRLSGIVPVAPIFDVGRALDNPFAEESGMLMEAPHPKRGTIRTLATPIRFSGSEIEPGIAPSLGQHTRNLLNEIGYDDSLIDRLYDSGAI